MIGFQNRGPKAQRRETFVEKSAGPIAPRPGFDFSSCALLHPVRILIDVSGS